MKRKEVRKTEAVMPTVIISLYVVIYRLFGARRALTDILYSVNLLAHKLTPFRSQTDDINIPSSAVLSYKI